MSFEIINYDQKRVRQEGNSEWKLWFSHTPDGLAFRLLTRDNSSDCSISVSGMASTDDNSTPIHDDDYGDAHPTTHWRYKDDEGQIDIMLELGEESLAWLSGTQGYGGPSCSFNPPGPLMPESAG